MYELLLNNVIDNSFNNPKVLEKLQEDFKRWDKVFCKINWPLCNEISPTFVISELYDYLKNNPMTKEIEEEINEMFIRLYDDKALNKLLDDWEKEETILKRLDILKEAILDYKENKFFSVICLLLSQLEGIVADKFNHSGRMEREQFEKYLHVLFDKHPETGNSSKYFYIDTLLEKSNQGSKIRSFRRHAILHGEDTNFGSKANSLKLILLTDELIKYVA